MGLEKAHHSNCQDDNPRMIPNINCCALSKRRYQIYCTQHISGITFIWYAKCVIPSPRHSSESQGSAFQPKWSLYVIAIDHGLIENSEEKLENETVFVR
jgi:hypothetical protein